MKIKIKHLGEESRIIKNEKAKWLRKAAIGRQKAKESGRENPAAPWMFDAIHLHRVNVVRPEARDSNLAYGFIRGHSYATVEEKRYTDPNWRNVLDIVKRFYNSRYGMNVHIEEKFAEWKAAAPPRLKRVRLNPRGSVRTHRTLEEWNSMNAVAD